MSVMTSSDIDSGNVLAKELLPLARKIAFSVSRRLPSHVPFDDVFGAGMVGLADALSHFSRKRSSTFKSYAAFRIRGEILDELRRLDPLSREDRAEQKKSHRAIESLGKYLGREPNTEEISMVLGLSLEKYDRIRTKSLGEKYVSTEGLETELAQGGQDPCESVELKEVHGNLARLIEALPQKQRRVLHLYYYKELSVKDIAKKLDISSPRVCQIRDEALLQLRRQLVANELIAEAA
jgi:RNA polymerase sigma factor FliA